MKPSEDNIQSSGSNLSAEFSMEVGDIINNDLISDCAKLLSKALDEAVFEALNEEIKINNVGNKK